MKLKKIELAMILSLVFCLLFHMVSFGIQARHIRADVFRLHILANSDSQTDQALKLKVRDAILAEAQTLFSQAHSVQQAKEIATEHMETFRQIALREIQKNGFDYSVQLRVEKAYFDTRYYRDFTLPAGEYEALRVFIGSACGQNWWCVMFPALCMSACDNVDDFETLSDEEKQLIVSNPKVEVRFKCVEIYEKIKNKM